MKRCLVAAVLGWMGVQTGLAIEIGVPAPPLSVNTWVKGEPVDLAALRGKKVVVVEFWATWCPPCRESIPHLTQLQKQYTNLAVVGITSEEVPVVKRFVAQQGAKMDYAIGIDSEEKTLPVYMAEYLPRAPIPWAWVVDKEGVVVWGGSAVPGQGLEEALKEVFSGKLTGTYARRRNEGNTKLREFAELANANPDNPTLAALGKDLEALDAELGGIRPGKKFEAAKVINGIKFNRVQSAYLQAVMVGNSSTNIDRLEKKLTELAPPDFDLADFKEVALLNKDFNAYMRAATGRGDTNQIPELTKRLAETKIKMVDPLLQISWNIILGESLKPRDLGLATGLAKRAVELSQEKQPEPLFIYGKALFETGKLAEAIEWQKKALAAVGDNEGLRRQMESELAGYEARLKQN